MDIRVPDDFHLHLRQGALLRDCIGYSSRVFARGLVMPNIKPPVSTPEAVRSYSEEIRSASGEFTPLMTFKILPGMSPADIRALKEAGCIAGKLYPAGATTNAEDGVVSTDQIRKVLGAMEETGLVLSIHGEVPGDPILTREISYIPIIEQLSKDFSGLRIVFEHLSTKEAVKAVRDMPPRVGATITPHHLHLTLDDMIGGNMNPHHFCKPVIKQSEDRKALVEAAVGGNPKFFFGSDSAPHPASAKLNGSALPGIFCAPVALPVLAEVFENTGSLDRLEDFTSRFGAEFYGLPLNSGKVELEKKSWTVPASCQGVVPMLAGSVLSWTVSRRIE